MNLFTFLAPFYDLLFSGLQSHQGDALVNNLPPVQGQTVLDLGGGTGKLAARLLKAGADIFLLDSSSQMLGQARRKLPVGRVIAGDATQIPFPDNFFKIVLAVDAVHHFTRQQQALCECHRVLLPGGLLFVLDLSPESTYIALLQRLERLAGEKSVFLKPGLLEEMLVQCGFFNIITQKLSRHEYLTKASR